jgi:RNA polymerase sigma-70 factor, ECF subfamily
MTKKKNLRTSDAELVRSAQAGEFIAFELLTNRYEDKIFALASRMLRRQEDAEDVTRQTFLSALEDLTKFHREAQFSTWLLRIATDTALKAMRERKRLQPVTLVKATEKATDCDTLPYPAYIADRREPPEELARKHEIKRILEDALGHLDEKHRLVFLLRDVEGFSVREAAGALRLSEATTKMRLLRARLHLRECLTRLFGNPASRIAKLRIRFFPDSAFTPRLLFR